MASEETLTSSIPPSSAHGGQVDRTRMLLVRHAPLAAVLALSAAFNSYALAQNGYANIFYSAGVKSMLGSLHDLVFNSFDPGGLIAIDKPPLALWLQTASAKLFGFSPLALLLPEAIAGVLAVGALYWAMIRPFGRTAALCGALVLALFPAFVAVSRDNGPDPLLILLLTLACVAALRAIESGRLSPLLVGAVLLGLAFNTKTLAAYLLVPPIALAYLACAPGSLGARATRLAASGLLVIAISLSWSVFVDSTPAGQRPYVGGSTDNSELGLTLAYNGLGRVGGQEGAPGEIPYRPGATVLSAPPPGKASGARGNPAAAIFPTLNHRHAAGIGSASGPTGPLRLLGSELGGQGGWLLPFALGSLIALLLAALRRPPPRAILVDFGAGGRATLARGARTPNAHDGAGHTRASPNGDRQRLAAVLVLGGWFLVEAVVLSLSGGIVHPYYVSALAPGAAAMVGAGAVLFVELVRGRDRLVLLLAVAIAATVAAQTVLLERDRYLPWLPALLVLGGLFTVAVAGASTTTTRASASAGGARRHAGVTIALMLGLLLIAPTAYAATTWMAPVNGTFPAAGPHAAAGPGGVGLEGADPPVFDNLHRYLDSHDPGTRFSVLAIASLTAAPLILMGSRAAALGGYGGNDPALDGLQLARLVARGEARYVLLGGAYSERGGNKASAAVLRACRELPAGDWGGPPLEPYSLVLFDCKGRETRLSAATAASATAASSGA